MNLQHAPGPWRIQHPTARQRRTYIRANECGVAVAQVCARIDRDGNAALIAAAPRLLAALKGVVRVADRATEEFDAARAAIAEAEGRA